MDKIEKRVALLENIFTAMLKKNDEVFNRTVTTFKGIVEEKSNGDDAYLDYLDEVIAIMTQKIQETERVFNIFMSDLESVLTFFEDDLSYLKYVSQTDIRSKDIREMILDVEKSKKAFKDKEIEKGVFDETLWKEADLWMESMKQFADVFEQEQKLGMINEEDMDYLDRMKKCLVYHQIVLERVDANDEGINADTFSRMMGGEPGEEDSY